jgi:hypothetical protein
MAFVNGQSVTADDLNNFSVTTVTTSGAVTVGGAIDVASSITAGSGNVEIVNSAGKIPAISSTYFANLSGAALTGIGTFVLTATSDAEATTTSSSFTSVKTLSSLTIVDTSMALLVFAFRRGATAESVNLKLLVNAVELLVDTAVVGGGDAEAQNGWAVVLLAPRTTNYPLTALAWTGANQGGVLNQAWNMSATAHSLTGTITSLEIQAKNSGGTATVGVAQVKLYVAAGA